MSNKLRIILNLMVGSFFIILTGLLAFEPEADNFSNAYQYELYLSWLEKGGLKADFPAGFTSRKVVKDFNDIDGEIIHVEYDWEDWKIYDQREVLPFVLYAKDPVRTRLCIRYLEEFIYRLNSNRKSFVSDFFNTEKIGLQYSNSEGTKALDLIWKDLDSLRISVEPIELETSGNNYIFNIPSKELDNIIILFPNSLEFTEIIRDVRILEKEISSTIQVRKPEIYEMDIDEENLPTIEELSLTEYLRKCSHISLPRELLHNKIKNIPEFLEIEFPYHELIENEDIFFLTKEPYQKNIYCDIKLKSVLTDDGIDILPESKNVIRDKKFFLTSKEILDLSALTPEEINNITPYIPQLIYEHRALGSRLLNFLLIHDNVPTTLIVRSDKREIYEIDSYADLLMLLNSYWQNRLIFFSINDVKKIEGCVEFKGYLIAGDPQGDDCDMAEILFHLDKEFKIDLIMMILHPEIKKEAGKG